MHQGLCGFRFSHPPVPGITVPPIYPLILTHLQGSPYPRYSSSRLCSHMKRERELLHNYCTTNYTKPVYTDTDNNKNRVKKNTTITSKTTMQIQFLSNAQNKVKTLFKFNKNLTIYVLKIVLLIYFSCSTQQNVVRWISKIFVHQWKYLKKQLCNDYF